MQVKFNWMLGSGEYAVSANVGRANMNCAIADVSGFCIRRKVVAQNGWGAAVVTPSKKEWQQLVGDEAFWRKLLGTHTMASLSGKVASDKKDCSFYYQSVELAEAAVLSKKHMIVATPPVVNTIYADAYSVVQHYIIIPSYNINKVLPTKPPTLRKFVKVVRTTPEPSSLCWSSKACQTFNKPNKS